MMKIPTNIVQQTFPRYKKNDEKPYKYSKSHTHIRKALQIFETGSEKLFILCFYFVEQVCSHPRSKCFIRA